MPKLLLLGAGFSRNWGGWLATEVFEYLLGTKAVIGSDKLRQLLWKHQLSGGFEAALAELQMLAKNNPAEWQFDLAEFESAVLVMFSDMNSGFLDLDDWDLQTSPKEASKTIASFLNQFDAIFTLNQDLLLEEHYLSRVNLSLISPRRWDGASLPGLDFRPSLEPFHHLSKARGRWIPQSNLNVDLSARMQPIYKLHGSSNWQKEDGSPLLIMGGNKTQEISTTPILQMYQNKFAEYLSESNARLMVIGYGFGDEHINEALTQAVELGLKIFLIDPMGAELALKLNKTRSSGQITCGTSLESVFQKSLIGGSRRSLKEIFDGSPIEYKKVMNFFI